MKASATALGVARSNLVVQDRRSSVDAELVAQLRPFIDERATYGHRRAAGMLNRQRRGAASLP